MGTPSGVPKPYKLTAAENLPATTVGVRTEWVGPITPLAALQWTGTPEVIFAGAG